MRHIRLPSLFVILLLVSACGGEASPETVQFPSIDTNDARLLYTAEQKLVAECMRSAGFEYEPAPFLDMTGLAFNNSPSDRRAYEEHEFDDVSLARSNGYGIALRASLPESSAEHSLDAHTQTLQQYLWGLTVSEQERFDRTLTGKGGELVDLVVDGEVVNQDFATGCYPDAQKEIYGSQNTFLLWQYYKFVFSFDTEEDAAYRGVLKDWSECMSKRSFDVEKPVDAIKLATDAYEQGDVEKEFAVATAEADCNVEVGLLQAGEAAIIAMRQDRVDDFGVENLVALAEAMDAAVERAKTTLGTP